LTWRLVGGTLRRTVNGLTFDERAVRAATTDPTGHPDAHRAPQHRRTNAPSSRRTTHARTSS